MIEQIIRNQFNRLELATFHEKNFNSKQVILNNGILIILMRNLLQLNHNCQVQLGYENQDKSFLKSINLISDEFKINLNQTGLIQIDAPKNYQQIILILKNTVKQLNQIYE